MPESIAEADILTEIILAVFRVNGRLLQKGDELVEPLKLTSARWQVLGAVSLAGKPLSTPQIGEAMGISRQGAQKQINKLRDEGFLEQLPNPKHERSPLYALTALGARAMAEAMALQKQWAMDLAAGLPRQALENTLTLLNSLYARLEFPVPKQAPSTLDGAYHDDIHAS
ncbi:MAG: MarR family winged helix-turn-helix transcriptional regulator [Methylomonas sp.]|jgi:DNA-binding MarR family transcriptional regulator